MNEPIHLHLKYADRQMTTNRHQNKMHCTPPSDSTNQTVSHPKQIQNDLLTNDV